MAASRDKYDVQVFNYNTYEEEARRWNRRPQARLQ